MKEARTLIIDGQVFQGFSWHRGMGKYSLELLRSLDLSGFFSRYDSVQILTHQEPGLEPERRARLSRFVPSASFVELPLEQAKANPSTIEPVAERNREMVERHCDAQKTEVDFLILSLFDHHEFISVFPDNADRKMLLYYDLIPYLFAEKYLSDGNMRGHYFTRFKQLFSADQVFTISETTRRDLIVYLGMDPERLVNIKGAPISREGPSLTPQAPENFTQQPFILLPTGEDVRKNNERAFHAFERFNQRHHHRFRLIATSNFSEINRKKLGKLSENAIFVGNVSESEIEWLFQNASVVLFPSIYEGLGLPILEALQCQTPVACSDIGIFREIAEEHQAFHWFNPLDIDQIADAIDIAIDSTFNREAADQVVENHQWSKTAKLMVEGYDQLCLPATPDRKIKLAVVGPVVEGLSTIGKMIQGLHLELSRHAEIEYFLENNETETDKPAYLDNIAPTRCVSEFDSATYQNFDAVIYHIGNSDYHLRTYWLAQCFPGHVILHDTKIESLLRTAVKKNVIHPSRAKVESWFDRQLAAKNSSHLCSLLNSQFSFTTHSEYARQAACETLIKSSVRQLKLNLPIVPPVVSSRKSGRTLNIGLAGILHSSKGLENFIEMADSQEFSEAKFQLFGHDSFLSDTEKDQLEQHPSLEYLPNLSEFEFQTRLQNLDILINFRTQYHGESSYATLEAMRHGVAVVVRDIGWFSELPDNTVVKVSSPSEIRRAVRELIEQPLNLEKISVAAIDHVRENHTFRQYARQLVEFLDNSRSAARAA